ncbi:hypothetical protein WA026_002872 [Henosepilachna vigintioctopunctata]|uniref:Anillin homology domain-containing protein n=1 Tax=Henosepilachna vigintioctopunctata TaxID=420089 RepID=A0AAW1TPP6_9CUCU
MSSSVEPEECNKHSVGGNKFSVFKTDENDVEVKHSFKIPKDFCPESQCIEFKIESPVMKIIPKNQYKSVRNFKRKAQNRTHRRMSPIEKKGMRTASRRYQRNHNIINTSIFIPRSIHYQSGNSVDINSGSSEDQESTTDNKVQSKINKFNALIENINASKRIRNVITKSIENLTIIIFGHRESSVDTGSDSSEDQKSMTKYSSNTVQTRINEFNTLFENTHSSKEIKKALTKSVNDLSNFIYGQPQVQSRIKEYNNLIQKMNTMSTMTNNSKLQSGINECNFAKQNLNEFKEKEDSVKIEEITDKFAKDFIVSQPGTSVESILDSSKDRISMINHSGNKVPFKNEKIDTLIENISLSGKILEDVTKSVENRASFILSESGTSVLKSSEAPEDPKLMIDYSGSEVPFESETVNTLKKNMSAVEKLQEDITKSMEELANFILSEPGTSVDTTSESSDDQESIKDYSDCKVKSIINKLNAQIKNMFSSEKTHDNSKKSTGVSVLPHPDSFVRKHINLFETVCSGNREASTIIEKQNFGEKKFRFELSDQCGPTCETVKKYFTVIEELKQKNDSNIVKQLILQRFENDLEKFVKRAQEERLSGDSGNDSTCEHCFETSLYQEIERAAITPTGNTKSIEASQQVCERKFLELSLSPQKAKLRHLRRNISGRSRYNGGTYWRNSVGTSHLSELVSTASFPLHLFNNRRISEGTYASITESSDWTLSSTHTESTIRNLDSDGETIKDEESTRKWMAKFGGENSIISQISKAFEIFERGKCSYKNLGSIEAERILLAANLRTMYSMEGMSTPVLDNIRNERRFRHVRLSNIVVPLTRFSGRSTSIRFFVFVFRCGPTLLYSDLLWSDEDMEVKSEENFIFRELPTDFEIIFQIYSLKAKLTNNLKGSKSKGPLKKIMRKVFLPRRREKNSKTSAFKIYGEAYLNRYYKNYGEIPINNSIKPVGENFRCNIDISDW